MPLFYVDVITYPYHYLNTDLLNFYLISLSNEILHTLRQLHCRDVCKMLLLSLENILNHSTANFDRISNPIKISLVGWAPRLSVYL